jgi:hypothetical protein
MCADFRSTASKISLRDAHTLESSEAFGFAEASNQCEALERAPKEVDEHGGTGLACRGLQGLGLRRGNGHRLLDEKGRGPAVKLLEELVVKSRRSGDQNEVVTLVTVDVLENSDLGVASKAFAQERLPRSGVVEDVYLVRTEEREEAR